MTTPLFKNVATFTDIHFGLKHNSRQHNDDCEEFVNWFVEEAKKRNCETCIMLGDFHHHRSTMNISTLNYSISNLRTLNNNFEHVYIITGNHDLFYREKREISSLVIGNEFPNITVVSTPLIKGDVAIVPWLINDEWKSIKEIKTRYMFGHFEIPGFKMNAHIEMPDHGEINKTQFSHQEYVFSGHFHKRQTAGKIHYIGNPFGHNYSDSWDFDRGAMFLQWGGIPEYVNWDSGPRYITCYLSEMLDNIGEFLKPKTSARVTLDVDMSYEDISFIKESVEENYDIRELKFMKETSYEEIEFEGEITFQTVDEIITEQLSSIDSNSFDNKKLMEIYRSL